MNSTRSSTETSARTSAETSSPTAAMLLIGNELLSGRTQDKNLAHLATALAGRGIRLCEARVIADNEDAIVAAVNELRARYTYVFTTGGIGPTHDDITADCIAKAFGVALPHHPEAMEILLAYFKSRDVEPNDDRLRMARVPEGGSLIRNAISAAPGFRVDNVFVFAGVPKIMQAMLDEVLPQLAQGQLVHNVTVICNLGEGTLAAPLRALQENHPNVDIGSYPGKDSTGFRVSLVARGVDTDELAIVEAGLIKLIADVGGKRIE